MCEIGLVYVWKNIFICPKTQNKKIVVEWNDASVQVKIFIFEFQSHKLFECRNAQVQAFSMQC